ncbi:translation initiation factor IF-2 [Synechococcus sp. PCC 7502]|uniref:translation initiation factor IF-2 n=1 Tax=Synechococcus sp. PCC 7502 TaxID=1173263 RepID=UPI00029FEF1C|nr:translation initiation factor IF-2 [Synechococcus sp. PCC 7502]AFY73841.1 translation initiation factor IF-2 [Synechococcus sp. PCC 7502]
MNKVRVYELTRELGLETKDIIALCEQLSIAVKTASSSISEADAEKIRSLAPEKKLTIPPTSTKIKESKESSNQVSKQQIVTVSKPTVNLISPPMVSSPTQELKKVDSPQELVKPDITSLVNPGGNQEVNQSIAQQSEVVAPSFVAKPPTFSREPLKPLARAASDSSNGSSNAVNNSVTKTPASAPKPVIETKKPKVTVEMIAPVSSNSTPNTNPTVAKPPKPQQPVTIIKQPKPTSPSPVTASTTPRINTPIANTIVSKPTLPTDTSPKQPKAAITLNQSPTGRSPEEEKPAIKAVAKPRLDKPTKPSTPSNPSPRPSQPTRPLPVKDSVLIERGITAPNDPPRPMRTPNAPPLRSPDRPTPPSSPRKETDLVAIAPISPPILPGRGTPIPTRLAKRGKSKKEDEEQDLLEQKEKAKLNRPNKRFLKVIDEDDIIEDLETTDIAQVSLSLARPASRPKQRSIKVTTPDSLTSANKVVKRGTSHRDRRSPVEAPPEKPTKVTLQESISVQELAHQMSLPETDIIRTLFMKGVMANINQTLDIPTASMVATELGYEVEITSVDAPARKVTEMIEIGDLESLQRRPPVVTIMGHVDHGKTTLLDSIRKTKVAQGEAGGITQHIGAYHVDVEHDGKKQQIVFLDTPGHQAFTAMRARGARVTDVAILVVAADDGVQPQTIEAISHAKAAKVPIIVAINKVDKLESQPDRIRQELTEYGLVDEAWGGDTIMVPVSALKGENLDSLLEMILLVSEVEDLQANPDRPARGTVIEAHLDKARGPVATLLIQNGTLRVGDILVAGSSFGKVRAMVDDRMRMVKVASPSFAVEVLGLSDVPAAGDEFEVYTDEKLARGIANDRSMEQRQSRLQQAMASRRVTLGTVSAKAQEGELKELNLILKGDVQGSLEAILGSLEQLPQGEVQVRVLLSAVGEITENDVELAAASDAIIIGFNTSMAPGARQASDSMGVDVRDYSIIYKLLEDIQGAMEGLLEPELIEEHLGIAEVRALFPIGRGVVAGCYVQSGKLVRNSRIRIKRRGELVHESALDSLKRMKDDVKEVAAGFECGIALPKFQEWEEGDSIEAFRMITKRRTLLMN